MESLKPSRNIQMEVVYKGLINFNYSEEFTINIVQGQLNKVTIPLGMIWVLKIKDNGRYSEILVSKGFLQREGVEYNLSHLPLLF